MENSNLLNHMRIFNGTPHPIRLFRYQEYPSYNRGLKGHGIAWYLADFQRDPEVDMEIPEDHPFSVSGGKHSFMDKEHHVALPNGMDPDMEFDSPAGWYDVVVVSSRYAKVAGTQKGSMDPFYLDSLYLAEPLYKGNPDEDPFARRIGTAFLSKFKHPLPPAAYLQRLDPHSSLLQSPSCGNEQQLGQQLASCWKDPLNAGVSLAGMIASQNVFDPQRDPRQGSSWQDYRNWRMLSGAVGQFLEYREMEQQKIFSQPAFVYCNQAGI